MSSLCITGKGRASLSDRLSNADMNGEETVRTVDPRPRPPSLPPNAKLACRMVGRNPTLSEIVVQNVMRKCCDVDSQSRLVSMTRDMQGHTHMRVRAGDVHSVATLQRSLAATLPLAECSVSESWIDGTLEAEILIFTAHKERSRARAKVAQNRFASYWLSAGTICVLVGVGQWMASFGIDAPTRHDEL